MGFLSRRKFTVLLVVILSLNVVRMATVDDIEDRFLLDWLGAGLLISATLSLCVEPRSRVIALVLGLPAVLLSVLRSVVSEQMERMILIGSRVSSAIFLAFIVMIILRTLLTRPEEDSIAGAFVGYVFIGVMFAEVYCLLELLVPHSFRPMVGSPQDFDDPFHRWLILEYFSFTTLTTLGFGDVVPMSPLARGLTTWEVICGQFYLAVLVAGLINLRSSSVTDSNNS